MSDKSANELLEYLEDKTDGRKHVQNFNGRIASLVPDGNQFFIDTVLVYDTATRSHRKTENHKSGLSYGESWKDILNLMNEVESSNTADVYVIEGFGDRMKANLEQGSHSMLIPEPEVVQEITDYFSHMAENVDISQYQEIDEIDSCPINYWDRKLISAAKHKDATILTYDDDFLGYGHEVDVATPGRAIEKVR